MAMAIRNGRRPFDIAIGIRTGRSCATGAGRREPTRWPPGTHALAAASPICFNAAPMAPEAHSATTYPSSAALYDFGFAYRYAWRFS
jgi:hypothetical protein